MKNLSSLLEEKLPTIPSCLTRDELFQFALEVSKATIEAITPEKKPLQLDISDGTKMRYFNEEFNQCVDEIIKKGNEYVK